ncbi:AGE family epimerase/isomerase [Nakamurella antarctica]|uniref:AGE family epimerase/isomerase n=1 Tax=Nakamurella antarctica TaxID=1902245 RepID=A0A3G8ZSE2_9ACTN|nr:AGE family epimerase/isomerase [Nakamurella antarctica]AZI57434.1 AGE family epimerase/isomerase [Nakamurella antarctica]
MTHHLQTPRSSWLTLPSHVAWLNNQVSLQFQFAANARLAEGGFGYLGADGRVDRGRKRELYITCRTTYVAALAHLRGEPGALSLVDHGISALQSHFRDAEHGGWYSAITDDGAPVPGRKSAYDHAFVLLACSSAAIAGRPGADELLREAQGVIDDHFWDEEAGLARESFAVDWSDCEDYRGANSNMHLVEAFLAAGDALGDPAITARTVRICDFLINHAARANNWLLPEHFDATWNALPDYNKDLPAHPFRPYGATPGHFLEWARLLVQVDASNPGAGEWMIPAAKALFDRAIETGWHADGRDGFVYTVGWDESVIIDSRLFWVLAEAIGAAALLLRVTGDPQYSDWYEKLFDHAARYFVEPTRGTWIHELDNNLVESGLVWPGRPDCYHVTNALLLPQLPLTPATALALAQIANQY